MTCGLHVAIVGSGPSGFYCAKYLTELDKDVRVDIVEKLPTPYGTFAVFFSLSLSLYYVMLYSHSILCSALPSAQIGLVRYGVAPDHETTKNVMATFREIAARDRVRFIGNVKVVESDTEENNGIDKTAETGTVFSTSTISVGDLLKVYSAVVFATGASGDKKLGIPGEELTVSVRFSSMKRYLISSHLTSNGLYSSHLNLSHLVPSRLITPRLMSCHTISSHVTSHLLPRMSSL